MASYYLVETQCFKLLINIRFSKYTYIHNNSYILKLFYCKFFIVFKKLYVFLISYLKAQYISENI